MPRKLSQVAPDWWDYTTLDSDLINSAAVHERKRAALAAHACQKHWLDVSQGMDSYLVSMDEMSRAVGQVSGHFEHAEGWRRHLHLGFSASDADPLREALGDACVVDEIYEAGLSRHA